MCFVCFVSRKRKGDNSIYVTSECELLVLRCNGWKPKKSFQKRKKTIRGEIWSNVKVFLEKSVQVIWLLDVDALFVHLFVTKNIQNRQRSTTNEQRKSTEANI